MRGDRIIAPTALPFAAVDAELNIFAEQVNWTRPIRLTAGAILFIAAVQLVAGCAPMPPSDICDLPTDLRSWNGREVEWSGPVVGEPRHGYGISCERRLIGVALSWGDDAEGQEEFESILDRYALEDGIVRAAAGSARRDPGRREPAGAQGGRLVFRTDEQRGRGRVLGQIGEGAMTAAALDGELYTGPVSAQLMIV